MIEHDFLKVVRERTSYIDSVFGTKNTFTEFLREKGGGRISSKFRTFKEDSEVYETLLKFLDFIEYMAVNELKIVDPGDKLRVTILQYYSDLPQVMHTDTHKGLPTRPGPLDRCREPGRIAGGEYANGRK